jgi:endonuclease VIII
MEGPSLVILKEEMRLFVKKKVLSVSGYANKYVDFDDIVGQTLQWIKPWGKHFLYKIGKKVYKTHFGLFGTYRVNEETDRNPSLRLEFENGFVMFLISSVRELTSEQFAEYDWRVDTMAKEWDEDYALKLAKQQPDTMLCDLLLDQNIFSGSGNIIKNEVLFRQKLYPELKVKDLPARKLRAAVKEVRNYSLDFYRWKKKYELRKHWQVYKRWYCPVTEDKLVRKKMGKGKRMTFYCPTCQAKP